MLRTIAGLSAATLLIGMSGSAAAQTTGYVAATAVTFTMPVNLTKVSPDLERVALLCAVMPSEVLVLPTGLLGSTVLGPTPAGYPFRDELPVVAGQVVGTLSVVFPLAAEWFKEPIGKNASYGCQLAGYSRSLQRWGPFTEDPAAGAFYLKPAPTSSGLTGTFVW